MAWLGRGTKHEASGPTKELRVGLVTPIHTLDPRRTQDFGTVLVLSQIFETPYAPQHGGKPPVPVLFDEPLRQDERGSVFSARVRAGVEFSDGTPMTARHVASSLAATEVVARAGRVEAEGDRVVFRLERPDTRFDLTLSQTYCSVLLEKDGDLLGTGPFRLVENGSGEAVLERNPHYRQDVRLDRVVFRVYPPASDGDASPLRTAIENGEVDFTSFLSRDDVAELRDLRKHFLPGNSTAILHFNTERELLSKAAVRRAIALAVDPMKVARTSFSNPLAFVAGSLLPPMLGTAGEGIGFHPERAREALSSARATIPGSLDLLLVWGPRPYLPHPALAAQSVADQLHDVGLRLAIVPTATPDEYNQRVRSGEYDMVLSGWIADSLDPLDFLEATLSSELVPIEGASPVNRANRSRWKSAEMDALLRRYREERSEETLGRIAELVRHEAPLLPIMYGPTVVVHSWRVLGFEPSPIGLPSFAGLDVDTGAP